MALYFGSKLTVSLLMALYFGSQLTVSLLLSYDGFVFWFKADCFIVIVL
jgi:hypothetical protein